MRNTMMDQPRTLIDVYHMASAAKELHGALRALSLAVGEWSRPTAANGMMTPDTNHPLMVAFRKANEVLEGVEGDR